MSRVEVEEAAENQRQLSSSWNNISNYELSTLGEWWFHTGICANLC